MHLEAERHLLLQVRLLILIVGSQDLGSPYLEVGHRYLELLGFILDHSLEYSDLPLRLSSSHAVQALVELTVNKHNGV